MDKVRLGVVGVGVIGSYHLSNLKTITEIELAGVCDIKADLARKTADEYHCRAFTDYKDFVRKDNLDAVLICTPHYFHPPIAIHAFEQGVHVLCEKPMAVTVGEARKMIDAHARRADLKFGIVFHLRMIPLWKQVKKLITGGQVDKIFRVSWIITDWFRTQTYYNSGGWRGTWKGEGGGVLMNQCPHQLDLIQWLFGLPSKITAICRFGHYHDIEVEDDVHAMMEYADGGTMTFSTTTGEYPGSNRLEISGNRGRIVVEKGKITFDRTVEPVGEYTRNSKEFFGQPEFWPAEVPVNGVDPGHRGLVENFARAILGKEESVAPGQEGINSLMLANAMVYSGLTGKPVTLPLDPGAYDELLKQFIAKSKK